MTEAQRLREVYDTHPLSAESVLRRANRHRLSTEPLDELDLAIDPYQGLTDQNHLGGHSAVIAIARTLGVQSRTRVLDVGSGLGGPARLLAHVYGCSVLGVELDEQRLAEAVELTRIVRLEDRVSFISGDFLDDSLPLGRDAYDVVLSLDSLVHFPSADPVLGRGLHALKPGGAIAIDNPFLRGPSSDSRVAALNSLWASHLEPSAPAVDCLRHSGCAISHQDLSSIGFSFFDDRLRHGDRFAEFSGAERRAWALAHELMHEGILTYERIVATKVGTQGDR